MEGIYLCIIAALVVISELKCVFKSSGKDSKVRQKGRVCFAWSVIEGSGNLRSVQGPG